MTGCGWWVEQATYSLSMSFSYYYTWMGGDDESNKQPVFLLPPHKLMPGSKYTIFFVIKVRENILPCKNNILCKRYSMAHIMEYEKKTK